MTGGEVRLIDANQFKRELIDHYNFFPVIVKNALENAPAVDAVEVVRCKDCISGKEHPYINLIRCNVMGCAGMKPDDFCSYGKRREDDAAD